MCDTEEQERKPLSPNHSDEPVADSFTRFSEKKHRETRDKYSTVLLPPRRNLSSEQYAALCLILEGHSTLITGAAGTGKSFLLQQIVQHLEELRLTVNVTASTGIAASNLGMGATTLHSFIGAKLCKGTPAEEAARIVKNKYSNDRWRKCEVLIIDEISMVPPVLFAKAEEIGRLVRRNPNPFGGLQVICCGDWAQLNPVIKQGEVEKGFEHLADKCYAFETDAWMQTIKKIVVLERNFRQEGDQGFLRLLNDIRVDRVDEESHNLLRSRVNVMLQVPKGLKPTIIFPKLDQVKSENNHQLEQLPGKSRKWARNIEKVPKNLPAKDAESLEKSCLPGNPSEETVFLRRGATVILIVNLRTVNGDEKVSLYNGLQGVVLDFNVDTGLPLVQFNNQPGPIEIAEYMWRFSKDPWWNPDEGEPFVGIIVRQIPLKLAFAITIHRCISEHTLVYSEMGLMRIRDIARPDQPFYTPADLDLSVHSATRVKQATTIYKGCVEQGMKLVTSLGFVLECSVRHRVILCDLHRLRWKPVPELFVGNRVMLRGGTRAGCMPPTTKAFRASHCANDDLCIPPLVDGNVCVVLGLIAGKTRVSSKFLWPSRNDPRRALRNALKACFGVKSIDGVVGRFLRWCGMDATDASARAPWSVLSNTIENQRQFVKGVRVGCKGSLETTSERLSIDLQNILLNDGEVYERRAVVQGLQTLYLLEKSARSREHFRRNSMSDPPYAERRPSQVSDVFEIPEGTFPGFLLQDTVTQLERHTCMMYDLTVPDGHDFVAGGFINHNSQGMTLDYVILDLGKKVFAPGQAYTGLSRCRSLEGLSLINYRPQSIKVHPLVVAFYRTFAPRTDNTDRSLMITNPVTFDSDGSDIEEEKEEKASEEEDDDEIILPNFKLRKQKEEVEDDDEPIVPCRKKSRGN